MQDPNMIACVTLHEGREKSLLRHHPWVFSKAISSVSRTPDKGELVKIISSEGSFLAWGFYSPKSQIRIRVLSFLENKVPDENFIVQRIKNAVSRRRHLIEMGNDGVRLIASEGDFLPGIIVDKYNEFIVLSISSCAMEKFREIFINTLAELFPKCSFYERSDTKSRKKEGLDKRCGLIRGTMPPTTIYVKEGGEVSIPVDIINGHKTGAYLDQRQSRIYASSLCKNARVLNCFCYTGGFGLWALKGGANKVENVDVSQQALDEAKSGVVFNHLDPGRCRFIRKDVFEFLRTQVEKGEKYDVVILDPPKFAENASNLHKACRGYQDINRLGFKLVKNGGHLLTFSCSGLVDPDLFQKIVADAAIDANTEAVICATLRQDEDHCVSLPCPESFYLKGLDCKVIAEVCDEQS